MRHTNETPGPTPATTTTLRSDDTTAIDGASCRRRLSLALLALMAFTTLAATTAVARADTKPALTVSVECGRNTVAITATGQGEGIRYTALNGPLTNVTLRVVNTPIAAHTWAFATDVADLHADNTYDVRYRIDLTSDTQGNGTVLASKTVLTPKTCAGAKTITVARRGQ